LQVSGDGMRSAPLPFPLVRFLRLVTGSVTEEKRPTAEIAAFLEKDILGGRVERQEAAVPTFSYKPTNRRVSIPLRASSSMVTELAPFLFLLRNADLGGGVVFE